MFPQLIASNLCILFKGHQRAIPVVAKRVLISIEVCWKNSPLLGAKHFSAAFMMQYKCQKGELSRMLSLDNDL